MRFCFAIALALAFIAPVPVASAQEKPLSSELANCTPPGAGAVLVTPEAPHRLLKAFCSSELKTLDCQILSHVRNYIFYSYGRCMNPNGMFDQTLSRASCASIANLPEYNSKIDHALSDEVWQFIRGIRKIEAEKGCLADTLIPD
jgi:hypothetical protein